MFFLGLSLQGQSLQQFVLFLRFLRPHGLLMVSTSDFLHNEIDIISTLYA
nr:MAG TPA: hypothetical protein [Caudoviricetes sp.]